MCLALVAKALSDLRAASIVALHDSRPWAAGGAKAEMKKKPGLTGETMSNVRVNKARNLLRKLLARAVKNGWLSENPVDDVQRLRETPAVIDPLSWSEVRLLLDKGVKHDPEMQRYYTVKIFTGMRDSELIGLKWTDLDWTGPQPLAVIKHSFTKHDGEHLTKTPGSARAVELRPQGGPSAEGAAGGKPPQVGVRLLQPRRWAARSRQPDEPGLVSSA